MGESRTSGQYTEVEVEVVEAELTPDRLPRSEKSETIYDGAKSDTIYDGAKSDTIYDGEKSGASSPTSDRPSGSAKPGTIYDGEKSDTIYNGENSGGSPEVEREDESGTGDTEKEETIYDG